MISIIISAFKDRGWLDEAIRSAKYQTFQDREIILSSEGNADLERFAEEYDIEFILTTKSNHSTAFNNAVAHAKGEWIKECHDDDSLLNTCLEDLYEMREGVDLIYGNAIYVESDQCTVYKSPPFIVLKNLLPVITNPISYPAIMFKRETFLKVGGFDAKMEYCEDYDFYINLLTHGYKFAYCNKTVAKYRVHDNSQTSKFTKMLRKRDSDYIRQKYGIN